MFKKLEGDRNKMRREKKDIKKTHLEMTTTISKSKTTLDGINSWLDTAEEKISELEDIAIEVVQNEEREKKDWQNMSRTPVTCGNINHSHIHVIGVVEGETEKVAESIIRSLS